MVIFDALFSGALILCHIGTISRFFKKSPQSYDFFFNYANLFEKKFKKDREYVNNLSDRHGFSIKIFIQL